MKRAALAASVLFFAASADAQTRLACGPSSPRGRVADTDEGDPFLRTTLPASPAGSKVFFEGKIELANTMLPVRRSR